MGVATGLHERRHAPTLLPVACALEPARGSRAFRGNGLGLEAALDNAGVRLDTATVDEAGESHLALEGLVDHFSNFALGAIAAPTLLEPCGPFGEHWPCTGQHLGVAPEPIMEQPRACDGRRLPIQHHWRKYRLDVEAAPQLGHAALGSGENSAIERISPRDHCRRRHFSLSNQLAA